jgi:hypothetical protein
MEHSFILDRSQTRKVLLKNFNFNFGSTHNFGGDSSRTMRRKRPEFLLYSQNKLSNILGV